MTINVTSPVTGAAQTGFTSPTYTLTPDTPPDVNGKQWAVTAIGGTQSGVLLHSVAAPFTISCFRPKTLQGLGKPNPVTGVISNVPNNSYKIIVRKGVLPLAGQPYRNAILTLVMDIPAGSDLADPSNLRAALSLLIGSAWQQAAGVGDTSVSGLL